MVIITCQSKPHAPVCAFRCLHIVHSVFFPPLLSPKPSSPAVVSAGRVSRHGYLSFYSVTMRIWFHVVSFVHLADAVPRRFVCHFMWWCFHNCACTGATPWLWLIVSFLSTLPVRTSPHHASHFCLATEHWTQATPVFPAPTQNRVREYNCASSLHIPWFSKSFLWPSSCVCLSCQKQYHLHVLYIVCVDRLNSRWSCKNLLECFRQPLGTTIWAEEDPLLPQQVALHIPGQYYTYFKYAIFPKGLACRRALVDHCCVPK